MSQTKQSHLDEVREPKNNFQKEYVPVAENQLLESPYKPSEDLITRNILFVPLVIPLSEMVPFMKKRDNLNATHVIKLFSAKNVQTAICRSRVNLSLLLHNLGIRSVLFAQVVAQISRLANSLKEREGLSALIVFRTFL